METNPPKTRREVRVVVGVKLTRAEEIMVINKKGTWNGDTQTLPTGKVLAYGSMDAYYEARNYLLTMGERDAARKKAEGKGPKGHTAGQRAFASRLIRDGYA